MAVEITHTGDADRPGKTIYGISGPSFEQVQLAIENLAEPQAPGSTEAHFSIPFYDRKHRLWLAYGTVQRIARAQEAA